MYECVRCGHVFKLKTDLKRHYNRKKMCKTLNQDYSKDEMMNILDKSFQCQNCGKIFTSKYTLNNHKKNRICIKNELTNIFPCDTCGKKYFNKNDYDNHIKTHTNSSNKTIVINNYNYTNYNIMMVNNFGKENINYLTNQEYMNQLFNFNMDINKLNNTEKNKINSINLRDIMNDLYFNEEHKENNNIYPVNIKNGIYKVKIGDEYLKKDADFLFNNVLNKIVNIYQLLLDKKIDDDDKFIKIKDSLIKLVDYMNMGNIQDNKNIKESEKIKKFLRKSLDMLASDYKEKNNFQI